MEIIFNRSKQAGVDGGYLRRVANRISRKNLVVSVSFVSSSEMRRLNRVFRGKGRPTDVLSFEMNEGYLLGDVMICPQVAKANAKKFGTTYKAEIARLLAHGILHLLGHEHGKKMFDLQDKITGGC